MTSNTLAPDDAVIARAIELRMEENKKKGKTMLTNASIVDDGDGKIEIRIADGIMCPRCKVLVRNFPEETRDGWRLLCPNHHDIIAADRRSYREDYQDLAGPL